jgi:cytochrome c-type biogenesis protein CcmE
MKNKIKLNVIGIGMIFLLLVILLVLKAIYVDDLLFYATSVRLLGGARALANDAVIFFYNYNSTLFILFK